MISLVLRSCTGTWSRCYRLGQHKIVMENKKDSPGVYIPTSFIFILIFFAAVYARKIIPIPDLFLHQQAIKIVGILLLVIALFFLVRSFRQFFQTKNTIITIMPAFSLQTKGVYNITRNPMYVGLLIAYLGAGCLTGNGWAFILFPLLFLIVQEYVIKSEEKYLERRFGQEYLHYKAKVRRWL